MKGNMMSARPKQQGPLHRLCHEGLLDSPCVDQLGAEVGVNIYETHDCFEQACAITAWQQLYDQLSPGDFSGQLRELWLDQLQCFEEYTNRALRQSCIVWPGAYWFGVPIPNQPNAACEGSPLEDNLIAISWGGAEFELTTPDDFHIMGLVIPHDELTAYANTTLDGGLPDTLGCGSRLQVDPLRKQRFIRHQRTLLNEAERCKLGPADVTAYRFMRHELQDSLINMLTSAMPAPRPQRSRHQHWCVVRQARDFAMGHSDEPLGVADLCQYLGVSRRTLQNIFQNTLGICPLTYLKSLRLNAVRRELLSPESRYHLIQDVASAWGFWHMSQFAVDYGKLFGEKPSATRLRRSGLSATHPRAVTRRSTDMACNAMLSC